MSQSVNNSLSNRDVPIDFHFNGVYDDVIEYSQILVNITTSSAVNSYTLTIYYSDDKLQYSTIMSAYTNYTNQNLKFTPKSRYFKLSITTNTSMDRLVIETMYKNTNIYDNSILTNLFDVNITQSIPLAINNFPALTEVIGAVYALGSESQFKFYATPDTNTSSIYADGAQGENANGGWLYVNTGGSNKINWYVYANTENEPTTAKRIKDIKNQYMVIYQKATEVAEVKNPYIAFYSLKDAGTNSSWYKNRYVFENNYEQATTTGTKLLYIGVDDPLIHPEITVRIKLEYSTVNSTNTILGGADEILWLSSIHTSSNAGAGEYNFVFSEYGLNFNDNAIKTVNMPIIDNKVQVELTTIPPITIKDSIVLHTILDSVSSNITVFIQERPTTNAITSITLSATGLVLCALPQVLRKLSITNTGASIAFVYIYNMSSVPTGDDQYTFIFAINGGSNIIINPFDHSFSSGIAMRATTILDGTVSPLEHSIILNMTLSD